ncbi:MAG: protein kinase [Planctomycetota bacterium]
MTSTEPPPAVADLVFEFLECIEDPSAEPTAVLETLCDRWPSQAERLRKAVHQLAGTGLLHGAADDASGSADPASVEISGYRLLRPLGSGGMGVVHVAQGRNGEPPVALKMLRPDLYTDHEAASRFRREIEVAAQLDHPNIVRIVDRGTDEGDRPFLAMELHDGGTLDRVVAALVSAQETPRDALGLLRVLAGPDLSMRVPKSLQGDWWQVVIRIVREVARALAHAHARGVVHRDVKPSNVLVTPMGRTLLLDFGLASLRGSGRLTVTGTKLGSLPYMSPEQVTGEGAVDARVDVYALAVTAYELLTLRLPFAQQDPDKLAVAITRGSHAPPSRLLERVPADVARDIDAVLECAMDVEPARRYASADAFAAELTAILERRPVVARPPSLTFRAGRWLRRRPFVAATIGLALLTGIGVPIAYGVLSARHSRAMEQSLEATLTHMSGLIKVTGRGVRDIADGPLRREPQLVAVRLESTTSALQILDDVERDGAEFLNSDHPRAAAVRDELALARALMHTSLGDVLYDELRLDEAIAEYRASEQIFRSFVERSPDDHASRREIALVLGQQARAHHRRPIAVPALAECDESAAILESLVEQFPDSRMTRSQLAQMNVIRASAQRQTGDEPGRRASILRAVELLRPLAASEHATYADRRRLLEALVREAELRAAEDSPRKRLDRLQEAERLLDELRQEAPRDLVTRFIEVDLQFELAFALVSAVRFPEAARHIEASMSAHRGLQDEGMFAGLGDLKAEKIRELAAFIRTRSGNMEAGLDELRSVVEVDAAQLAEVPDSRSNQMALAVSLVNLAGALKQVHPMDSRTLQEVEDAAEYALVLIDDAEQVRRSEKTVEVRRAAHHSRAITRARAGDLVGAVDDVAALEAIATDSNPIPWTYLADACAEIGLSSIDFGQDPSEHWEAALEHLERAADLGFDDPQQIRSNDAYRLLVDDPRFRAVVRRVEGAGD